MKRLFFLLMAVCFLLTACVKQQILDKTTIFIICAFDKASEDQIEFTLAAPIIQSKGPGSVSNLLISKVGQTSPGIKELMELELNRPINTGKVSVMLFGKEMAAKGLSKELDIAWRDAQSSRLMHLAVVDGKAKELLQAKFSSNEEKGMFMFDLLDKNKRKGLVPGQNLHEFEYSFMRKGMDPFLPLLKLQGDHVMLSGLALFKDDKYVMSLNVKQMHLFKLLLGNAKQGIIEASLDDGSRVAMKNIGSKVHYQISKDMKNAKMTINLNINSVIVDSTSVQFPSQEIQRIKDNIEKDLTTTGIDLIELFKKEGIDPLGFGDFVRSKTREWNENEWRKQYRTLNFGLNVKVNLKETGIQK